MNLCPDINVSLSCPVSCGKCCEDSSTYKFNIKTNKKKKCKYLKTNERKNEFCGDKKVKAECALRCRNCQDDVAVKPDYEAKCIDTKEKFIIDESTEKTCRQIINNNMNLCDTNELVLNNCPVACGLC